MAKTALILSLAALFALGLTVTILSASQNTHKHFRAQADNDAAFALW